MDSAIKRSIAVGYEYTFGRDVYWDVSITHTAPTVVTTLPPTEDRHVSIGWTDAPRLPPQWEHVAQYSGPIQDVEVGRVLGPSDPPSNPTRFRLAYFETLDPAVDAVSTLRQSNLVEWSSIGFLEGDQPTTDDAPLMVAYLSIGFDPWIDSLDLPDDTSSRIREKFQQWGQVIGGLATTVDPFEDVVGARYLAHEMVEEIGHGHASALKGRLGTITGNPTMAALIAVGAAKILTGV